MKPELATGRIQEVIDGLLMALDFKRRHEMASDMKEKHIIAPKGVPHVEQAVEDLIALRKDIEKEAE